MTDLIDFPAAASAPRPLDRLEPIETASRDEISALQLSRLKRTLQSAYDNVPHYRKVFDDTGVHPADLKDLSDLWLFPFTTKADPIRSGCLLYRSRKSTGTCVIGYNRPTDGSRVHRRRHRHVGAACRP